jgi:hypothetical protein
VHYGTLQDSVDKAGKRYKCPPCCEQLFYILGHEPYDRGELVDAGGIASDDSDSEGTPQTPPAAPDPTPSRQPGLPTKRATRDYTVQSPVKKKSSKSTSVDDCIASYQSLLQQTLQEKTKKKCAEEEETARIRQLLVEDGYSESDLYFHQALAVCTNTQHRREILRMTTKEGRQQYVQVVLQMQLWAK